LVADFDQVERVRQDALELFDLLLDAGDDVERRVRAVLENRNRCLPSLATGLFR
jgi:hypothetical protein